MKNEFVKQLIGGLVRQALIFIAGLLVAKGFLTEQQVSSIFSEEFVVWAIGGVLALLSFIWLWLKVKFNVNIAEAALLAKPSESLDDVKEKVFAKSKTQTSI